MDIRNNVKYILEKRGMKQTDLARKLGVTKQQIQSYIRGNATIDSLLKMAIAMDTTVEAIVSETPLALKNAAIPNRGENNDSCSMTKLVCPHCGEEIHIIAQ